MTKLIVTVLLALAGAGIASAQNPGPPAPPAPPAPTEPPAPTATPDAAALRKTCTDAMNADPAFAMSIAATVDKQIDQKTIDAHTQAAESIAENERHVILAYAAMWILAVLFVVFLWRRQQLLKTEIAQLRKDLEASAKEPA